MVIDDTRIACISTLTVDATGEFDRKDRVPVQKSCNPVLADDLLAPCKVLHLHLPLTFILGEMLHLLYQDINSGRKTEVI